MTAIVLATEDALSEEIGERLVTDAGLDVIQRLRGGGRGYLRKRMSSFAEMARRLPVLVITDLDQVVCPATLITDWLPVPRRQPNLLLRVAVREVESWLLADTQAMRQLLGGGAHVLPRAPDSLTDPKATLLQLARRAPRAVREDLVPPKGAIASRGLGYNTRLCELVRSSWDPSRAARQSPSLERARQRLKELSQRVA
jgi:hypothetical protein